MGCSGLHLEQYRHATRRPEIYWREALRRDPEDARCNLAIGKWHLRRGEWTDAEKHLRDSVIRLTARNPNPYDGEAHYQLGRCLRERAFGEPHADTAFTDSPLLHDAYAAFYKATWNQAWQSAAFHALAEIDACRRDWATSLDHVQRSLRLNTDNLRARNLQVLVLRELGRHEQASTELRGILSLDPLDWWAFDLREENLTCDTQVRLDLALDYARTGFLEKALNVLSPATPEPHSGAAPLLAYYRAWLCHRLDRTEEEQRHLAEGARATPDYCFPARLEEIGILEHAIAAKPDDARAPYYLGNLLYDRRRHREAIAQWERAVNLEPGNGVAWRNLGIASFNILGDHERARAAYERAFAANPEDARLLFERDQLWKRLGEAVDQRLRELQKHPRLVAARDDLSIELCALLNQTGQPEKALEVMQHRSFQPWEGGEGLVLGQHVRTHLALGRQALESNHPQSAIDLFTAALNPPQNLGEARHPLANASDIHYWLGCAHEAAGSDSRAHRHWQMAAEFRGDFQEMSVQPFSELTAYSALALQKLGRDEEAEALLRQLLTYARDLARTPAQIDYFATSLPSMLLFEDNLQERQTITARFLEAQAYQGLGDTTAAQKRLDEVLRRDPSHPHARDLV